MERLVRDDCGLEGRRDALRQQRLPRDGGEERVPLHALDAIGACGLVDRGIAVQSTYRLFSLLHLLFDHDLHSSSWMNDI